MKSTTQYASDLEFDLSRSLKVKCAIGLLIYGFLLVCNSTILLNWAPLQDTRLRNMSFSRSLKFNCNGGAIEFCIYYFLLVFLIVRYSKLGSFTKDTPIKMSDLEFALKVT